MVRKFFRFFNRDISNLHGAAYLLGASAIGSQMLALVRDRLFASTFGAGETLDIYFASFRIPDLLYVLIASFVSGGILIPLVVGNLEKSHKETHEFLNNILTAFLLLLVGVSFIVFVSVPYLVDIFVPGFTTEQQETFILLTRILLLQPIFLGLSNILSSITQALRRFFVYALSPILYNVGIIIGILFLYEPYGMAGLAGGVVIGALLHLSIHVPVAIDAHLLPRPTLFRQTTQLREVFINSIPRAITLGSHHILIIIFTSMASFFATGSIAIFNLSYNLQSVPLAIIGVSYSIAAFPTLSRLYSNGDQALFVQKIVAAGRHILFWSLPAISLFIVLRAHIVRVVLGAGEFGWEDTRLTAAALAIFTVSVAAQSLVLLFVRGYYASGNTRKPLIANVASVIVSIVVAFSLYFSYRDIISFREFFEHLFRVEGVLGAEVLILPLAFSAGIFINLLFLWFLFKKDFREHYTSIRVSIFQIAAGAIVMGALTYGILNISSGVFDLDTFVGVFSHGLVAGVGGMVAGTAFLLSVKNRELKELVVATRARLQKKA